METLTPTFDPIADAWERAWSPPDRRPTLNWAIDEVFLEGDYQQTGRFKLRESRYLELPFSFLDNDAVRMINLLKSPRTGGSLIGDVWLQRVFNNRPGPFMLTMQTDPDAERHYLTKIKKTFEATQANAALFAQLKQKRDLYQFPHMNFYVQGANRNSLQGKGVQNEWNDEVWIWGAGMLEQAFSRTEDYKRVCKILNVSQGGDVKGEWETVYNNGKRHDYGVRCLAPSCRRLQPFEFFATMRDNAGAERRGEDGKPIHAGIVWDRMARLRDGRWDISRAAETTRWRCMYCGHEHTDEQLTYERLAIDAGYVCHDPGRKLTDVSLRWNALVGGDWWRLVKKYLQAREARDNSGATIGLENFHRKELASFWDPCLAIEKVSIVTSDYFMEPALSAGYKATKLPWEAHRYITADYQQGTGGDTRHLLVTCRAWSDQAQNRSRLLWWGRCNTFADLYKLQLALGVSDPCVCVDGSFEMMEVAGQCAKYGWTMLVGDDKVFFFHKRKKGPPTRRPFSPFFRTDPRKGKEGQGKRTAATMYWSNPSIKNLLWNLRHGLTRHDWGVPADAPPEYKDGLDSEVKKYIPKKGSAVPAATWVKIKAYNHPWDDECMQAVCAVACGCLTFDIEEDDEKQPVADATKGQGTGAAAGVPTPPHALPDQLELLPT